jgi:hypothetical protein
LPDLKSSDWEKLKYYKKDEIMDHLKKDCPDQIDRIHYSKLSVEDFINKYEKLNKPVIIEGLAETCFPINKYWTFQVKSF